MSELAIENIHKHRARDWAIIALIFDAFAHHPLTNPLHWTGDFWAFVRGLDALIDLALLTASIFAWWAAMVSGVRWLGDSP